MKELIITAPNNTVDAIRHALLPQDAGTVATIRSQTASFKGAAFGPAGRAPYDAIMRGVAPPAGIEYEEGVVGGVPGSWCHPRARRSDACILFLHGGGYTMGSAQAYRNFAGHFAAGVQVSAFVADYRLAPEHPFPAALEDAQAAYFGLLASGAEKIVVVGDSAGGGLSLSLLAQLQAPKLQAPRSLKVVQPVAAVVMSPWTDLTNSGESFTSKADEELYLSKDMVQACANMYLSSASPTLAQASVLNGTLKGLPPMQIHVGTAEVLLDDSLRYARRAREANVDATLHVWEGMPHVFPNCPGILLAADSALKIMTSFISTHLQAQ